MAKQEMIEIVFTQETDRHDRSGKVFKEGEVRKMNPASAQHWIRRDLAMLKSEHVAAEKAAADEQKANDAKAKAHDKEKSTKAAEKAAKK